MRKILAWLAVAMLVCLGAADYVMAQNAETENPSQEDQAMVVKTSEGETVATVTNALIDYSGHVAFLILSMGSGQALKSVAVPVVAFSYDQGDASLVLKVSKDELTSAPEFKNSDLDDPSFAERVYRYFGQMPPWDEEQVAQ